MSFSGIVQRHTVSVDDMPSYVDVAVVDRGLRDAVQAWNNGGSVKFTMVKSDGDVNIGWNRGGAGLLLGHYGARVLMTGQKRTISYASILAARTAILTISSSLATL